MKTLLAALFATIVMAGPMMAQDDMSGVSDPEHVARAYMDAYSELDLDSMVALMNEAIIFADATNTDPERAPDGYYAEGRDAIRADIQAAIDNYNLISLGFEWDWVFESNDRVVFSGWVNARSDVGSDTEIYRWRTRQVAIVTVRDGQVIRHEDFADYEDPEEGLIEVEG